MDRADPSIKWLLESGDPSIQYITLTELLDEPADSKEATGAGEHIPNGPLVKTLLAGQLPNGGFGNHPYSKWTGAHWRLVSLVELGIPSGYKPAVKATSEVLDWLTGDGHNRGIEQINGLTRRCASQEGNALAVCSRLGLTDDPRVKQLAESLVKWQWPDGGWNCDKREDTKHSSFNESLATLWGLVEYSRATGDQDARIAADKASEFFLRHRLFRSCRSNEERPPETLHGSMFREIRPWTQLHYPLYWHYDILQALTILSRAGKLDDPRTREALDLILAKRGPDGLWRPEGYYWAMPRKPSKVKRSNIEVVDWGRRAPNKMITLDALMVLKAAGRID
jgi:hypothetical protein